MRRAQTHPEGASCGADVQPRNCATLRPARRFFGMSFRSRLAKPSQGKQGFSGSSSESGKWLVVGRHSVRPSIGYRSAKRPVASLPSMRICQRPRCMAPSAQPSAPLPLSTIAGPAATQTQSSDQQQQQHQQHQQCTHRTPEYALAYCPTPSPLHLATPHLIRPSNAQTLFSLPTFPSPQSQFQSAKSVLRPPTSALSPCSCSPGSSASFVHRSRLPT
jgi:hypothetical protein